jgi:hypothetical protein
MAIVTAALANAGQHPGVRAALRIAQLAVDLQLDRPASA